MSAEDDRIDPRFDPAFQRGYSGAAATLPPAPVKRIADSPPHPPPAQHRIVDAEPAPRGVLRDGDPGVLDDAPLPRTNPFLIALGVVAAAFIAARRSPALGSG